jgi:tol-pal system protein YbgF
VRVLQYEVDRCLAGWLLVVGAMLPGCASSGDVRGLRAEVATLRSTTGELGGELARAHEEAAASRTVALARISSLETQVAELSGHASQHATEMTRLSARLASTEATLAETRARLLARAPAALPETAPGAAARSVSPEQSYAAALATFRSGEHGQAVLDFTDFIARHPGHPLAADARYWIAEAYYREHDCRQALTEYQRVVESGADRAADALLRIGMCHASLRDRGRATQAWQRLVREHPDAAAASRARTLLGARRAGGRP